MPDNMKFLAHMTDTERKEFYVICVTGMSNLTNLEVYDQLKDPNDVIEEFENAIFHLKEAKNNI